MILAFTHFWYQKCPSLSRALVEKTSKPCGIHFSTRIWLCFIIHVSIYVAILTIDLTKNFYSVSLAQHDLNNFSNLSRLTLKNFNLTPILENHKKGVFPLKRAFFSENRQAVRRLSNQISSFKIETH